MVFSTIFSTIIFFLTDQPLDFNRYARFTFVYILVTMIADAFGLLLGAVANPIVSRYTVAHQSSSIIVNVNSFNRNSQNGTFFAAVITAFKLAFCGFLALWNHIPFAMRLFTYLSTHSYGLEALVLSIYDQNRDDIRCPEHILYCHYK